MYTLRRISSKGVQMNHSLGEGYTLVHREHSYDEFCRDFENIFSKKHVEDLDNTSDEDTKQVYAFVGNGNVIHPLYKNQFNYIMTESGATFSHLTYKF